VLTYAQYAQASWRYDLHPGDTWSTATLSSEKIHSDDIQSQVEASFTTHVLVAGDAATHIVLGFQRNRKVRLLLRYQSKGKTASQGTARVQKRMAARPSASLRPWNLAHRRTAFSWKSLAKASAKSSASCT